MFNFKKKESTQLYLIHRNKLREAAKTRRQRNMAQMKGQIKTPEKELNEMEMSNIRCEFKTSVVRMLNELSEDLSSIKKIQLETKGLLIGIKNNLQRNNSTMYKTEISVIWNIRKQKQPIRRRRRKKNAFRIEGQIKSFPDKKKLIEFIIIIIIMMIIINHYYMKC